MQKLKSEGAICELTSVVEMSSLAAVHDTIRIGKAVGTSRGIGERMICRDGSPTLFAHSVRILALNGRTMRGHLIKINTHRYIALFELELPDHKHKMPLIHLQWIDRRKQPPIDCDNAASSVFRWKRKGRDSNEVIAYFSRCSLMSPWFFSLFSDNLHL